MRRFPCIYLSLILLVIAAAACAGIGEIRVIPGSPASVDAA